MKEGSRRTSTVACSTAKRGSLRTWCRRAEIQELDQATEIVVECLEEFERREARGDFREDLGTSTGISGLRERDEDLLMANAENTQIRTDRGSRVDVGCRRGGTRAGKYITSLIGWDGANQ